MLFLISFLVVLFLLNFMWEISLRAMWAWGLLLLGLSLMWPATHWSDQSPLHFLGAIILFFFATIPVLAFIVRFVIAQYRGEIGHSHVIWLDHVLAGVTGGFLVAVVFRSMALDGFPADRAVQSHLWFGAIALVFWGGAYLAARLWRTGLIGAGFGLLALTVWSGVWYPSHVVSQAETFANGTDYQMMGRLRGPLDNRGDMTFLTMPKDRWAPHVVLSFEAEGGICNAAWSYFAFEFRTDNNLVDSRHCPRPTR